MRAPGHDTFHRRVGDIEERRRLRDRDADVMIDLRALGRDDRLKCPREFARKPLPGLRFRQSARWCRHSPRVAPCERVFDRVAKADFARRLELD